MEFKIVVRKDGYVAIAAFDLDDGYYVGERIVWRPEYRVFDVNISAYQAAREFAGSLAQFTGFDLLEADGSTPL